MWASPWWSLCHFMKNRSDLWLIQLWKGQTVDPSTGPRKSKGTYEVAEHWHIYQDKVFASGLLRTAKLSTFPRARVSGQGPSRKDASGASQTCRITFFWPRATSRRSPRPHTRPHDHSATWGPSHRWTNTSSCPCPHSELFSCPCPALSS